MMNRLHLKALRSGISGLLFFAATVFIPAGTLDYWQGWAFLTVFAVCTVGTGVYLARHDPKLLEQRLNAGPRAEKETAQKIIISSAMSSYLALAVFSALDWRFGCSHMPRWVPLAGDALIILSYLFILLVFRENSYGTATIQVTEEQKVISTGPYAIVRHPMYSGALVMTLGMPLALGSWWGLLFFIPVASILVWRLLDEERFLRKNLPGYTEYTRKVRWRLVPGVF